MLHIFITHEPHHHASTRTTHNSQAYIPSQTQVLGQAQALGMEAASRLRGIDLYRGKQDDYRLGGRPYYQALPAANTGRKEDYRTASFWRYVGEHYAASRKNGRAGIHR